MYIYAWSRYVWLFIYTFMVTINYECINPYECCILHLVGIHGFLFRCPSFEPSPRKFHTVADKATMKKHKAAFLQRLGVRNSDVDIIEVYSVNCMFTYQSVFHSVEEKRGSPHKHGSLRDIHS